MSGTDIPEHMAMFNWWACIRKQLLSFMQKSMPVAGCGSTDKAQWRRGLRILTVNTDCILSFVTLPNPKISLITTYLSLPAWV
ncbi:hypothetical protein MGG_17965 [Pyricularia oryzae 70-15]|uniref:Uncharacterized protein n=1 Tax=Pyricularia oryzae (strain 70-15 / ATCC MYA-4617 / FGSC 8958) TaxID=242507 RepID=G4NJ08_PYRO7|nr:uncharacterized protein MGG_17965 [Pyricularia oryzae 70-15]EHA46224.1 hypothetical protein MGG_17965 [Pyricularia oryzae 70-15]KAI7913064.1 hypothetical protein M9X92_009678 [Pyricularia oryzae]KAI7925274.1 hypothetical protein M0657_004250 [Pyricularia oryzae]